MAGDKMCKTREMMTTLTAAMDHKRVLANTKVAILNQQVHMKVVTVRTTKTTKVETTSMDKEATIKCLMTSNKK